MAIALAADFAPTITKASSRSRFRWASRSRDSADRRSWPAVFIGGAACRAASRC